MTRAARRADAKRVKLRNGIIIASVALVILSVTAAVLAAFLITGGGTAKVKPAEYRELSADEIAAFPALVSDAVIEGAGSYDATEVPETADAAYGISGDLVVYGDDRATPIARIPAINELGGLATVIVVERDGDWSRILLTGRSSDGGAQAAGWVRSEALHRGQNLTQHLVVSRADSTLSIVDAAGKMLDEYEIAFGDVDVPAGLGFIQLRYVDGTLGETTYPIQVTTLHATAEGATYGDRDGTAVVLHSATRDDGSPTPAGAILLPEKAAAALSSLPLGTLVLIT